MCIRIHPVAVWKELLTIPCGHTRSHQSIAEKSGDAGAVCAVGQANSRNPIPSSVKSRISERAMVSIQPFFKLSC